MHHLLRNIGTAFPRLARGALVASSLLAATGAGAADDYKNFPDKNVQFVVPFSAGGGSDVAARSLKNMIDELKLLPVSVIVENRTGSGGAAGYGYLAAQEGNPYFIGTVSVQFFTTPLLGRSPVNYKNFQPLAAIATDPYVLVVNKASGLKSIEDFKSKGTFVAGSGGAVTDPTLLAHILANNLGIKVKVVPFDGDGEVVGALLGGHVDASFFNLSEILAQIQAGEVVAIGTSTKERIPALPDVPTLTELGQDIVFSQLRGVLAPKNIPPSALAYWENLLQKVAQSDEWRKNYVEKYSLLPAYLNSGDFAAEIEKINSRYEGLLSEIDVK